MRQNFPRTAVVAGFLAWACAASLNAQDTTKIAPAANPTNPRELRYFRVEVPAGHENEWPLFGFEPYRYPIERAEFDRLLESIRTTPTRSSTTAPRIASLQGQAELLGDTLVGTLQLTIAPASEKALLSLEGINFAISGAKWEDGRAVDIGAAPDGTPVVVHDQGGKLLLEWSLRGTRGADEMVRFDLRLPRSQNARLEFIAPREFSLVSTRGLLAEQPVANEQNRRWLLELGSLPRTQLVVGKSRTATLGQDSWLTKQFCSYTVDEKGLRLTTDISLQSVANAPTSGSLKLHADAGLRIVGATVDGAPIEWESSTVNGVEQVLLTVDPSDTATATRTISLAALGEFPIGAQQALPALRPQNVIWQSGQSTVTVAAPLEITALSESGGQLAGIAKLNGARSATVDFFDPAGRIKLACAVPAAQLAARATYVWRFGPEGIEARLFAELTATSGAIYDIAAPLAAGWEIDDKDVRVFSTADGEMVSPLAESRVDIGRDQLQITLDSPITRQRPLRLEITARRKIDTQRRPLTMAELLFARIHSQSTNMPIGIATTLAPQRVRVSSATAVARVARDTIPPVALTWIPTSAVSSSFVIEEALGEQSVEIVRDPPRIDVDMDLTVDATRQQLSESYDIQIRPDASGVERLRIDFWPPRREPLTWSMSTAQELPVVEFRRLEAGEPSDAATGTTAAPEVWEVKFHERQSAPFVLHATRSSNRASAEPARIAFASVEEATEQAGRVVLRSPPNVPLQVANRRLRAVAAPTADEPSLAVRGAYRFEPARVMITGDASLSISPTATVANAWAWRQIVDSQFTIGQEQAHSATWLVQNEGAAALQLRMPPGSHRHAVEVDGRAIELLDDGQGHLLVPLPSAASLLRLRVEYTTSSPQLKSWDRLDLQLPQIDVPVLRTSWRVALPEGYVAEQSADGPLLSFGTDIGERLFGSWYRHAASNSEDSPLASGIVAQETVARSPEVQRQLNALWERLRQPKATWGQALLDFQLAPAVNEELPSPLWIDALAVAESGVQQQLPVQPEGEQADSLESLLLHANLAVLVVDRTLILTSLPVARLYRQSATTMGASTIVSIDDGLLAVNFYEPQRNFPELVTPQIWASPHAPTRAAHATRNGEFTADALAASRVLELELPDAKGMSVLVYRRDWLNGVRVAMMLLALGLAWLICTWRASLLLGLCSIAGATALLASTPIAVAASGVFLGLLLGAGFRFVQHHPRTWWQARPTPREGSTATVAHVATLLVVGLVVATWSPATTAADKQLDTPFPVWIPVDEKQQPTGDVYLPKAFYSELQARSRAASQAPRGWLLLGANYQLRLGWQGSPTTLQAEELAMVFDIDVAASSPQVNIPLPRAGVELGEAWALLDGEPVELAWREGQSALQVPVKLQGKHRLELRLRPTTTTQGGLASIDLVVPPSTLAKFQVTTPFDAPPILIDQSQGAVNFTEAVLPLADGRDEKVKRWQAAIGQIGRLQATWPLTTSAPASAVEFSVDELSWLDLTGEPRIDVKFRCEIRRGVLRELIVAAPAELKLLPSLAKWEPLATLGNSLATYRLPLERPADEEFMARISFQLPAPAALGRLLAPQIHVPGAHAAARSLLAVTLPSHLGVAQQAALRPIATEEFLRRWGEAVATPPASVFQCDPAATTQLLLQPVLAEPQSRDNLQVKLSLNEVRLELTADVEPISPARQLYELALPEGFSVQNVAVLKLPASESDVAEPVPTNLLAWWSTEARTLRLFLDQPATSKHQIRLTGAMPLRPGKVLLPMIRLSAVQCAARNVEILRHSNVVAHVVESPGYEDRSNAEPIIFGAGGQRIASLADRSPATNAATCALVVSANQPLVTGRQVTSVMRTDDNWIARAALDLHVAGGLVDIIRVQLPADFGPDVLLEPALAHRVVTSPDGGGRELLIFPPQAIAGDFHVTLQAACPTTAGQNVHVPDLRVRDLPRLERYIVVPRAIDRQNIQWQVDRLLALPDDSRRELGLADGETIAYRVVSDPFHAEMRALRHVAGVPLVRLADVRFVTHNDVSGSGWASFDLEPSGLSYCTVAVPATYRLVQIRADDMPAQTQPISPQRWRIALRPQGMPQRIEVFYQGTLAGSVARQITASAPTIEDVAVERTMWTIYGPPTHGRGVPQTGGEIAPLQQDLSRLRSLTEVMRLPRYLRLESTERETSDWFRSWDRRWQAVRRAVVRTQLQSPPADQQPALAELQAMDEDREKIAADLGLSPIIANEISEPPPFALYTLPRGDFACRTMVQGSNATQVVDYSAAPGEGESLARWSLALLLAAAGSFLLLARNWLPATDWPLRSSRAIGVLIGIAWALWLWPAWLGWAIIVLFLLQQTWPVRKRAATADTGSAVVVRSATGQPAQ